jgi:hypothetical protein
MSGARPHQTPSPAFLRFAAGDQAKAGCDGLASGWPRQSSGQPGRSADKRNQSATFSELSESAVGPSNWPDSPRISVDRRTFVARGNQSIGIKTVTLLRRLLPYAYIVVLPFAVLAIAKIVQAPLPANTVLKSDTILHHNKLFKLIW